MPRHYAVDTNVVSGTVSLDNVKTCEITYTDSTGAPVSFKKAPRVQITVLNATTQLPFKTNDVKTGSVYTGLIIGFQNKVMLDLEWQVMERA